LRESLFDKRPRVPDPRFVQPPTNVIDKIHALVRDGVDLEVGRDAAESSALWASLRGCGTELWLDTGDVDAASRLWVSEFTALTTNNSLLNAEVQKGIYDDLIADAAAVLGELDERTRVREIAFILNARHGLRLAQRFGGKVSVELHTDLAHDDVATVQYGRRYFSLCPEHFVIKVPLTPAGLLATRRLGQEGIPVNLTLGFSARQNYLATAFAQPSFVNVFLGRLGCYVSDNALGDGQNVGEKATLATQRAIRELSQGRTAPTRLIAASLRHYSQVASLVGVDVFTMPVKVVEGVQENLDGQWKSALDTKIDVALAETVDPKSVRLEQVWEIGEPVRRLAADVLKTPPATAPELVDRAHATGVGDLLPRWSEDDLRHLAADGKIPRHGRWEARIARGELAVDSLLGVAALAAFAADQKALDDRIRRLL
jgi:transaldolase